MMIVPSNHALLDQPAKISDLVWEDWPNEDRGFTYAYALYVEFGMAGAYTFVDRNPSYAPELAERITWAGDLDWTWIVNWHEYQTGLPPIIR